MSDDEEVIRVGKYLWTSALLELEENFNYGSNNEEAS